MSPERHTNTSSSNVRKTDLILSDLQPVIHFIAVCLRVLQWKGDEQKYSFVCFISLILLRSVQPYIMYCLLPCLLLIVFKAHQQRQCYSIDSAAAATCSQEKGQQHHHQFYQKIKDNREIDHSALLYDLKEIQDKVCFLANIKQWIQESDALCRAYHFYYSMSTKKLRSFVCIGVSCLFTISYAGWVILLQQQQIRSSSLLWFALLIVMCLHSPWVQPIQTACVRAIFPLLYSLLSPKNNNDGTAALENKSTATVVKNRQREYRFELYHHQRWWFPTGWSNLLLPQDCAVWTDVHLESAPSITNFQLPPKITTMLDNNQQRTVVWTWVDPKWTAHQDQHTDANGWQYGTWQWKHWTRQSIGLGVCTRRQKWHRRAQRIECYVNISIDDEQQDESTKADYWDNQSTNSRDSCSNSSCSSSGIITPIDPVIVSFDNKGERVLCRRLSNLSNKSVALNTTLPETCSTTQTVSTDNLYNKYCKTPKLQRFKRFSL